MHTLRIAKMLAIPALLSLVAGCAGGPYAQYPITNKAPTGESLIDFKDAAFKTARVIRVHHLDAFEHIEYARFETDDLTLEAVYDTSLNNGLVLQYDYWMERMVDTWNANKEQAKSWGEHRTVRAWHGEVEYQPYRLAGSGRECAGFNSEWDLQPRDPFGRPSKVLFGYVCANPGATLSDQRVAALLRGVTISQRPSESFVTTGAQSRVDQVAYNTAKGAAAAQSGNAEFPFNFGTPYFEGDSRRD